MLQPLPPWQTAQIHICTCTQTIVQNDPISDLNVQIAQTHAFSSVAKPGELGTSWSPFHLQRDIYYPASSKHMGMDFATTLIFLMLLAINALTVAPFLCVQWGNSFSQLKEKIRIFCDFGPANCDFWPYRNIAIKSDDKYTLFLLHEIQCISCLSTNLENTQGHGTTGPTAAETYDTDERT